MVDKIKTRRSSRFFVLTIIILLLINITLGYVLMRQARHTMITLMETRMLDISNTAASMIDGDVLRDVTPADEGTEGYETIMRTLSYFQDNIDLKYIYCVRDMGDGSFTFGLDPTVEDPGEFGSPVVNTDALQQASQGKAAVDEEHYEDAWGAFYSSYSPVFDSQGKVAGIIAVDFDAAWYNQQLTNLTRTTVTLALLSLLIGGGIVFTFIRRNRRRIESIHGQLNELENSLLQEMGSVPLMDEEEPVPQEQAAESSIDALEKQIQTIQMELKTQIAQVHGHAYQDGLTGVKNKQAYLESERIMDEKLSQHTDFKLAIVVCDVNGLKIINDTQGHKAGDEYLQKACRMICDIFAHSPVYRVGGDEFVVILTGRDYENRERLMNELHRLSCRHISTQDAIVSGGMAEYIPQQDQHIHEVFERADAAMYEEKLLLKSLGAVTREDETERSDSDVDFEAILASETRKHILIADDIETNREILGDLLKEDYDILYATDGIEAMEMLREHRDEIALLILDLYMPRMSGRDVLTEMQVNEDLVTIPVIVLTIDQEAELDCLRIGAMDFIPKPYPDIEIVKARISKCIELSENRDLIRFTQKDKLTGLFNVDYFVRYVNRYDQQYGDKVMDAVVCDINEFHAVNEKYGRQFGDLVLHSIGIGIRKLARKTGGIGGRKDGDTFLLYCPHQQDYDLLLKRFLDDLFLEKETADKVKLRFGVFVGADQEKDVETRFACAAIAADKVKKDPQKICGYYE